MRCGSFAFNTPQSRDRLKLMLGRGHSHPVGFASFDSISHRTSTDE